MSKNALGVPGNKKFAQVSLSHQFATELRSVADAENRSLAAQLEHWAKIARAVETVFPSAALSELKSGVDSAGVLSRVGAYLLHQNPALLKSRLAASQTPLYGVDEADPEIAIRKDPDGTVTRGRFEADGSFTPMPAPTERRSHATDSPPPTQRRGNARQASAKKDQRAVAA